MPEQADPEPGPMAPPGEGGDVAVESSGATDLSLVALIRQALHPSPEGSWEDRASVRRIGKFEYLREIGRGGFGTVALVLDPDLGRERALKVPNPETLDSPGALARFLEEARLAARVDHRNVVRIFEAETLGAFPYIVMEYCPDGSLGRWLAGRPSRGDLPQRWVAELVAEIAEGVHQAHLAGLLHRDIKPGNVLLERIEGEGEGGLPRFRPKIADFGLAKVFEEDGIARSLTVSGTPVGTWAYMSPEQARGDREIGATTDVYAIGAILHELLTGARLHEGLGQAGIRDRLLDPDPAPSPRSTRADLHRDLETTCRKCLEKSPSDRYQDASELTNDLRRYLDGLPILARPAPTWRRVLARVRRRPVRLALAGLVLASAVLGLHASSLLREQQRRGAVVVRLNDLESAAVPRFPDLIPGLEPTDPIVAGRLERWLAGDDPTRKLAASLVLGGARPEIRDGTYEQLLIAGPGEVGPITGLLREQMPDLAKRLALEAETPAPPGTSEPLAEAHDRRRANAAHALIRLDGDPRGWRLLRSQPDPQARSFLIHQLGPSGIAPHVLLDELIATGTETSIRRALIQAIGEIPPSGWGDGDRERVASTVLGLFRDDPDPGIHGSARWLLRMWGRRNYLSKIDERAGLRAPREGFRWRVGRSGLTFVTVDDPETGRVIEVSDTEVPRDLFLHLAPDHLYRKEIIPEADCPITGINYRIASIFCNKLTDLDGLPVDQRCYGPASKFDVEPIRDALDRSGYRLLTDREFRLACRAGTTTRRYHGDSAALLSAYAWYDQRAKMRAFPVATLKPNEFGLFDTLGNVYEVCHLSSAPFDSRNRSVVCGGSVVSFDGAIQCDAKRGPISISQPDGLLDLGFRVARTVRVKSPNE